MNDKKLYDLTNSQKNFWLIEKFYSHTSINNIVGYLKFDKKANISAIEDAFNLFINKNDSFKLQFTVVDDVPKQFLCDYPNTKIEKIFINKKSELEDFEKNFPLKTFDILDGFLFKSTILLFHDGSAILALNIHHLISDAWTMSLCLEQIYNNYNSIVKKLPKFEFSNPSYIEFIKKQSEYEKSEKYSKDKNYWENKFSSIPGLLTYRSGVEPSINANRKIFTFDKVLIKKIGKYCKRNSISDYVFLLSIFGVYFRNISNSNKFVIGNPVLNRSNFKEKNTTGLFVSTMPFIFDINDNETFGNLCKSVALSQMEMYRHIQYPYQDILTFLKEKYGFADKLYDVIFSFQNRSIPTYCKWLHNRAQSESLQIHFKSLSKEKDSLSIHYDYLTDIFSDSDIDFLNLRILSLINQVLDNDNILVSNMEIISKKEKKLLNKFNSTKSFYLRSSNIVKEFEKIVNRFPNKTAVVDSKNSYTYKELNNKANFLAKKIINLNLSSNVIAFAMSRSIDIYVAILAILKSGHTYMPIDIEYPIDRINFMLKNSSCDLLITNKNFADTIDFNKHIVDYSSLKFENEVPNINLEIDSSSLAYIMYTSGSTGTPKAVTIKHYNVLNFVKSMQSRLNYNPLKNNNVISVTTVCFDIFVFETFPTLLSGLTLVIANELEAKSPELLGNIISKYNITKILTTPSRIDLLFSNDVNLNKISSIKEFILGGEPLPKNLLERLQSQTNAKIYNLYGPTETTVYSTFKDMSKTSIIKIGKPINNTQILILNEFNKEQPLRTTGEIAISGDGVGGGYYHNPEKSKDVFIVNPYDNSKVLYKTGDLGYWDQDGELICLGRKDHQIKIRGYRVELDDISNNILKFSGIDKCVVVDKQNPEGKKFLCAYYVSMTDINIVDLKRFLVDILPNYMIPTYFTKLDSLPLTLNQKVDKKSLPDPDFSKIHIDEIYEAPRTEIEKNLCSVFEKCLNVKNVGINNDIFDYNVDSLELIQIQTKMLDYSYKLNTQDFYKYRTIKKISEFISQHSVEEKISVNETYLSILNNSYNKHPAKFQYSSINYKNILLLGATGYLGIHILHELLNTSSANITCIIRAKKDISSLTRISDLYKFYFNESLSTDRVTIVDSNITSKFFGLSENDFNIMSTKIDLAINAAANVKYYGNYDDFKKINFDVVQNLIDFCLLGNIKLFHISTMGVSGNFLVNHSKNYNDFDENNFYIGQNYFENVYIQTKFEAEQLLYLNSEKGLHSSIIRVGNLTGRYCDGVFQENIDDNAFYNILRIILKYKIIPSTMTNSMLEFTPVDFCAKAVCKLITYIQDSNYVFHIYNDSYIAVNSLLKIFEDLGYPVTSLSGTDFKKTILDLSKLPENKNNLKGVINDIDDDLGLNFKSSVNQKNLYTNSYLGDLDFNWPKIDKDYITKLINYMNKNNYI